MGSLNLIFFSRFGYNLEICSRVLNQMVKRSDFQADNQGTNPARSPLVNSFSVASEPPADERLFHRDPPKLIIVIDRV